MSYRVTSLTSQLHRHTARYPTESAAKRLKNTLAKIAARRVKNPAHRELGFLPSANLDLEGWELGELTDQGRWEYVTRLFRTDSSAWESGSKIARRYPFKLFTRSTDSSRVLETGKYWLQGYHGGKFGSHKTYNPDVVIEEGPVSHRPHFNDADCSA